MRGKEEWSEGERERVSEREREKESIYDILEINSERPDPATPA